MLGMGRVRDGVELVSVGPLLPLWTLVRLQLYWLSLLCGVGAWPQLVAMMQTRTRRACKHTLSRCWYVATGVQGWLAQECPQL